ncbi:FUSC family protein [Halalkalibacter krulwichiae]|uniref:Fusaric acid resistance protein family protein n=1 Tax=Halalkalibacter krulwichiae TaxID=199441 RepID=A0A1X9MCK9_9BACI|nr:aromatic acid exporter family protein [Halalkalibacter krulwichiae]ARK31167.1 Fusaric acid resistance protein family protein [Halalkalibacter krulwichiae]
MRNWIGRRVIKTGLAVFITVIICRIIDLPPTFAVITAIVTTEPTAADSLKKGMIRLPAAALGASFAIAVEFIFGQNAITYALVAMLTIIVCSKLKLDKGTLVATLTAVAMIPGTTDHAIFDFSTRISGTSIGILVSTFVNFFILPPKFGPILVKKVDELFIETAINFRAIIQSHFQDDPTDKTKYYRHLHEELTKAYQLTQFQHDEWRYRRSSEFERRSFDYLQKKLNYLHLILFHIGKICHLRLNQTLSKSDEKMILCAIESFCTIYKDRFHQVTTDHYIHIEGLKKIGKHQKKDDTFSAQICYELLSLHDVTIELSQITADERRFSMEEMNYPTYIFKKQLSYD